MRTPESTDIYIIFSGSIYFDTQAILCLIVYYVLNNQKL